MVNNNNTLASLMGVGSSNQTDSSRRFGDKRDTTQDQDRQFSRLFEDETSKTEKSDKGAKKEETGKSLIEGKKDEKEARETEKKQFVNKEKAKMDSKTEDIQQQLAQKLQKRFIETNKTLNFIYNVVYQNPDTMSLSEKQALQIEQNPDHTVGAGEFKKMLEQKGLKMTDLNLHDFAHLMKTKNHSQMRAYLDKLSDMKQKGLLDQTEETKDVEKGKEKVAEKQAVEKGETPKARMDGFAEVIQAGKAEKNKEAEEAAHKTRRDEVIDQVLQKIEVRNIGNKTELQMRLNPEYLGELKIKFTHDENGHLVAKFETTSREVKDLLNESIDDLKGSLDKRGLKLDKAKVELVDEME